MIRNTGYLVNCQNVGEGILQVMTLPILLFIWFVLFLMEKLPLWFFIALLTDEIFGDALRSENWESLGPILGIFIGGFVLVWIIWIIFRCLPKKSFYFRLSNSLALLGTFLLWIVLLLVISKLGDSIINLPEERSYTSLAIIFFLVLLRPLFRRSPAAIGIITLFIFLLFTSQVIYRI